MKSIAGRILPIPQGNYNPDTEYHMLDIVSDNGAAYIARCTVSGIAPSNDDGTNWQILIDISALSD